MDNIEYTIRDVARLVGLSEIREHGGEYYCVCPFCGDKRGKFSYIVEKGSKKNLYNCFKCREHGGALDLYMKLSPNSYSGEDGWKQAKDDIRHSLGSSAPAEYKKVSYTESTDKASDNICDKVYRIMLDGLSLNEEHKADLIRRGLSEKQIENFKFRSVPKQKNRKGFEQYVYSACKRLGVNPANVPGIWFEGRILHINMYTDGYLCPVYNNGKILGFQIRVDVPRDGAKYIWLSSANKPSGISAGSPMTHLLGRRRDIVLITEGILKSEVVFTLLKGAVSVIGIAGVKIQNGLKTALSNMDGPYVFEAFDADKHFKLSDAELLKEAEAEVDEFRTLDEVLKQEKYHSLEKAARIDTDAKHLIELIADRGFGVHSLNWDITKEGFWKENYKGLDDLLNDYPNKKMRNELIDYLYKTADDYKKMKEFLEH